MPNVRWPGGCFADDYHWRKGIGPADKRAATVNPNWGGVVEPNTFGTHEFMDFLDQIGSRRLRLGERRLGHAAGSGRVARVHDRRAADGAGKRAGRERPSRAVHGRLSSASATRAGIAAATCRPSITCSQMKRYSRFVRNFNPAQREERAAHAEDRGRPGGDGRGGPMDRGGHEGLERPPWSWDIDGLSLHSTPSSGWPPAFPSVGFGEDDYAKILKATLEMDGIINTHAAIMDKYDPDKKIALVVDEWGVVVCAAARLQPGLPRAAEQRARRASLPRSTSTSSRAMPTASAWPTSRR